MLVDEYGALLPGARVAGYVVRKKLGQGGFGIAYEAFNEDLGHRAAIKEYFPDGLVSRNGTTVVPRPGKASDVYQQFLGRFIAEARTLNKLDHPGIVKVRHLERANETAYLVMDFVEGTNLASWLERNADAVDDRRLRAVIEPVMDALAYVHDRKLLHRDISPTNIMINRSDRPILIDFGAYKENWQEKPGGSTLVAANPAYAPPEQLSGRKGTVHGPFTDVFALAATLYQAIAGVPPEPSGDRSREVSIGAGDPYQPVESVARMPCPPEVFKAIDQALRLNPSERPADVSAFRRALGWVASPGKVNPDDVAWAKVGDSRDPKVLRDFLDKFPTSPHARYAYQRFAEVEEERWPKIAKGRNIDDVRAFLADFKGGKREKDAEALLAKLHEAIVPPGNKPATDASRPKDDAAKQREQEELRKQAEKRENSKISARIFLVGSLPVLFVLTWTLGLLGLRRPPAVGLLAFDSNVKLFAGGLLFAFYALIFLTIRTDSSRQREDEEVYWWWLGASLMLGEFLPEALARFFAVQGLTAVLVAGAIVLLSFPLLPRPVFTGEENAAVWLGCGLAAIPFLSAGLGYVVTHPIANYITGAALLLAALVAIHRSDFEFSPFVIFVYLSGAALIFYELYFSSNLRQMLAIAAVGSVVTLLWTIIRLRLLISIMLSAIVLTLAWLVLLK